MRADQIARLREVEEKLADVFVSEADPDDWPEDRGDRYKRKRDAAETAMLLARTQQLIDRPLGEEHDPDFIDGHREKMIAKAERRAAVAVEQAMKKAKGAQA